MPPTGEDESMEEWSEIDDDAVAEVAVFVESPKEKTPRSGRSSKKNLKDHSKHQNNDSKDKSLMRRKSRDHLLKKQKSREDHSPTKAKSGKAKTPDKEHSRKRIGSQSKKESKKLKVPTKQQEPPRYDNFLKTSSFKKKTVVHTTSNSVTESGLKSSSFNTVANNTSLEKRSSISQRKLHRRKHSTSIIRSSSSKKSRRKSSVKPPPSFSNAKVESHLDKTRSARKPITRSDSKQNVSQDIPEKSQTQSAAKRQNLKRSVGRTSLEADSNISKTYGTDSEFEKCAKRTRKEKQLPSIVITDSDQSKIPIVSSTYSVNNIFGNESCGTISTHSPSPFVTEADRFSSSKHTTRVCPLGIRSQISAPSMIGSFLKGRRQLASSVPVCSPVIEIVNSEVFVDKPLQNLRRNTRQLRRQSNFKLVRLNSVKNKRRSMLRGPNK